MSVAASGGDDLRGDDIFPAARSAGLVVSASNDELIIYDTASKHVHLLNAVSAAIWRRCDGRRSGAEIAAAASDAIGATVDVDAVEIALARLADANLLVGTAKAPRTSRRWSRRKMAMLGAAAVPAVVSITAPLASASASDGGLPSICDSDPASPIDCPGNNRAVGYCCMKNATIGRCDAAGECVIAP